MTPEAGERADIVLCALNARYIHTSLGLRCLHANLGPLAARAAIVEFGLSERPIDMAEALLARSPRVIGIGVYVWNAAEVLALVRVLRALRPQRSLRPDVAPVAIVLGGPEVSFETEQQPLTALADYVITGEGEVAFRELCVRLLSDDRPRGRIRLGGSPDLDEVALPYDLYTATDLRERYVYVEASRGCPYRCAFCLSALDRTVRSFPRTRLLAALARLHRRGARHFRFIDRTFNLDTAACTEILEFFLERLDEDLFLHFEMVPARLPEALLALLRRFGPGQLQLEIGIQTTDPDVGRRIERPLEPERSAHNLRRLRAETHAHLHTDLIAGLPGETLETFAQALDWLTAVGPHEIQVGILKRLRGTPIVRHTEAFGLVFNPNPPYEILETSTLSFGDLRRIERLARIHDRVGNRGEFPATTGLITSGPSPFADWMALADWLFLRQGGLHGLSLLRLCELLLEWLTVERGLDSGAVRHALAADYGQGGRRKVPRFLTYGADASASGARRQEPARRKLSQRQERHSDS